MGTVRAIESVSVVDPEVPGARRVIKENQAFDDKDPLVKEYPWAFESDNIERATAAPGEKRNVSKK